MTYSQLNKLFENFFAVVPPLDPPDKVGAEPDRLQGDRVILGNGSSAEFTNGLDKIQVLEKTSNGEYAPVSMQTWLNEQVKKNKPDKIAQNLEEVLKSKRMLYYELGREYPTQLTLNDKNELVGGGTAGNIGSSMATPKPKLTFGQSFKKFFTRNWHSTPDGKRFDEQMLLYSKRKYISDMSIIRQGGSTVLSAGYADMKGNLYGSSQKNAAAINQNYQRRYSIYQAGGRAGMESELRALAQQEASKQAGKAEEAGWTVVETPPAQQEASKQAGKAEDAGWTVVESPLARQAKLKSLQDLKKSIAAKDSSLLVSENFFEKVSEALVEAMHLKNGPDGQSRAKQLRSSEVFQELLQGQGETQAARRTLQGVIQTDNLIDQFANIAMKSESPLNMFNLTGQEYKEMITSLGDHCKNPPVRLQKLVSGVVQEKSGQQKEQPGKKPEEKTQPVKTEKTNTKGMGGK